MLKRLVIFISLIVILSGLSFAQDIKQPAVAGAFYPASALKLSRQIAGYLTQARPPEIDGRIDVLISPHAGYVYSGAVAAYGYKAIQDKKYKSVIIIGPSHFADFDGISVYPKGVWRTPLGDAGIDSELSAALIKSNPKIYFYPAAFGREHSLEVQLPFLQRVLKDFKIVPIALRRLSYEDCQVLSRALADAVGQRDDVLLVASTDLSHFHPYNQACAIDQQGYQQGFFATSILINHVQYGTTIPTREILTGPGIVDASNVDLVIAGVEAGAR